MHILEADSIQLSFGGRQILSSVYLRCETGKIIGLLGRNGQGKSCLMRIIYGTLKCERSIRFDHNSQHQALKDLSSITYLPQFNFLPKRLSVKRILNDFGLQTHLFENIFPELTSKLNISIGSLSGGELRLLELYVVARSNSFFSLLDEPFTHLSPAQIEMAKGLLVEVKATKGLIITDHMYKDILEISDDVYVLANGTTHLTRGASDIETLGYARI